MTPTPFWKRWETRTAATLLAAIAVPFGTNSAQWTPSLKEDLALGAGIWVVGMLFQIAYSIHCFTVERLRVKNFVDVVDEHDRLLLQLQAAFRQLLSRHHDGQSSPLFMDYCRRHLERTLQITTTAAQRGQLEVRDHHFHSVDAVLAVFRNCPDRTFRCVWLIEPGKMFDDYWRQYMASLIALGRKRSHAERVRTRILFVYSDESDLHTPSVRHALGFVASEQGFDYAVMPETAYRRRLHDANLDADGYVDFGVYGDRLLYRTKTYDPVVGEFCHEKTLVSSYRSVHDSAMMAATQLEARHLVVGVTEDQFLNCDRA